MKILEEKYQKLLQWSIVEIERYRHDNANLNGLIQLKASQPMIKHIHMGGGNYIESNNGNYVEGNYIESHTGDYIQGNYINMSQDLSDAAREIQDLIDQLQRQGATIDVAQDKVAQDIANQAKGDSTMKEKLLRWGQSLGDATVSDVVKGTVKLAIRSAGIPLP